MAIFKKLITSASSGKTSFEHSNLASVTTSHLEDLQDLSSLCWSPYKKLSRDMLRLVIFSQGNRLIYDTETVISVDDRILNDCPRSKCGGFQYLPHASDTSQMAKMVFGTSSKPNTFKVHTLVNTDTLMVSRIFPVSKSLVGPMPTANKNRNCSCALLASTSSESDAHSRACCDHYFTARSLDALTHKNICGINNDANLDDLNGKAGDGLKGCFLTKTPSYSSAEPPSGFTRLRNASLQMDATIAKSNMIGENGMACESPLILNELRTFSPNRLSRARRRQLSLKGLFDGDTFSLHSGGLLPRRSRMSSCCSTAPDFPVYATPSRQMPLNISSNRRRSQQAVTPTGAANKFSTLVAAENSSNAVARHYGVAFLFPGEDKDFVFQHILQIESDIFRLIEKIAAATFQKQEFLSLVYKAWLDFCSSVCLLHNSLRLKTPVWLNLMKPDFQDKTASEFCVTLAKLVDQLNTKKTKFFLSTLISSVLMTHLSWVASIAPPERCSYDRSLLLGTSVIDSRRDPYNAMAAQFMELFGGIGVDNCLTTAMTVIVGDDVQLIEKILFVLSYFIRCSSVENKRRDMLTPNMLSPLNGFVEESSVNNNSSCTSAFMISSNNANASGDFTDADQFLQQNVEASDFVNPSVLTSNFSTDGSAEERIYQHSNPLFTNGITPPPTKIRALSVMQNSSLSSMRLPRQASNPQSRCGYELIIDAKQLDATNNLFDPVLPATASSGIARVGTFSSSSSNPIIPSSSTSASSSAFTSRSHLTLNTLERPSDFGRTLLAGVCNAYSPHFVLSGIDKRRMSFDEVYLRIHQELCSLAKDATLLYMTSTNAQLNTAGHVYGNDNLLLPVLTDSATQIVTDNICQQQAQLLTHNLLSANENIDLQRFPPVGSANCNNNNDKYKIYERNGFNSVELHLPLTKDNDIKQSQSAESINNISSSGGIINKNGGESSCGDDTNSHHSSSSLRTSEIKPSRIVVLADASTYTIKIISGGRHSTEECIMDSPFEIIASMLEEFVELFKQNCASTFLLSFIEDRLGSILSKSNVLVGMINETGTGDNSFISMEQMTKILDCHCSDLRLILNVAAVYSPDVLSSVL